MNKKMTYIKSLTLILALFGAVNMGFGQSIFDNPIMGSNPGQISPYLTGQTVDPNITVSGVVRGPGLVGRNGDDRYNASRWDSVGDSPDVNDYIEFTLTPDAAFEIDFISFVYTSEADGNGPINFSFRSSLDGYSTDIGIPTTLGTTIDLSDAAYQNISSTISFRFYAWGAVKKGGEFSINDFTFNGLVSAVSTCTSTVTWDGTIWSPTTPDLTTEAIINNSYTTNATNGSFSACSLTVNGTLNITDSYFVEVENDVTVDGGEVSVSTQGAFVQRGDNTAAGTFSLINGGIATLNKLTRPYPNTVELRYTYWSSPIEDANIVATFPDPYLGRRYYFDASLFEDSDNNDIDDNGDDWQTASSTMEIGRGYAVAVEPTVNPGGGFYSGSGNFTGAFNTGNKTVPVFRNDNIQTDTNWNLIGNPYPSAISAEAFLLENFFDASLNTSGTLNGVIYLWTHNSLANAANPGNEVYNFSQDDYATMNLTGGVFGVSPAISGGETPDGNIPSGQGFFASYANLGDFVSVTGDIAAGEVRFTNAMRMADESSNSQFFKISNTKNEISNENTNKLWVNLTSDNGVFNQSLIAYIGIATDNYDGDAFDAPKKISADYSSILYTIIPDSDKKFAIQGKAESSLNENEVIKLGFDTRINVPTVYTLSIAKLRGDFMNNNPVYLKDNLLNKLHDLSASDYSFTSEVGEFKDRFEIVFNSEALSNDAFDTVLNTLQITQVNNNLVRFSTSNSLTIKQVTIYDLLGRQLYNLEGNNSVETYNLSNLNNSVFIAKVELSNGAIVTKKAIKK